MLYVRYDTSYSLEYDVSMIVGRQYGGHLFVSSKIIVLIVIPNCQSINFHVFYHRYIKRPHQQNMPSKNLDSPFTITKSFGLHLKLVGTQIGIKPTIKKHTASRQHHTSTPSRSPSTLPNQKCLPLPSIHSSRSEKTLMHSLY